MKLEYILCAAIWYKRSEVKCERQPKNVDVGYVLCGRRHADIIALRMHLTGEPTRRPQDVQGFLTSYNRFVDRVEGNEIAIKAGQVVGNVSGDELISEDLY